MVVIYWGLGKNGGISSIEDLGFHRENVVAFMVVMKYGDFEEIQLRHWWCGERIWENLRVQRNLGTLIKNSGTQYPKQRVNRRSSNHGFIMLCLCQSLGCPVGSKSAYRWLQPWMDVSATISGSLKKTFFTIPMYHLVMTNISNIAMENPNHKWRFLAGK